MSSIEQSIKQKVESLGTPLKDWNVEIYRGVLTGFNDAFIIDTQKRSDILDACADEDERTRTAEIIRPILRGRDIRRYSHEWANLWLLWIPWHFPLHLVPSIQGASEEAEKEFMRQFPAVYKHLLQYKAELSERNKAETGIRYEWYAMQRWGANYWDLLSHPKIIWGEISDKSKFCIDVNGEYVPEATSFMLSGDRLLYLLAFLNCSVSEFIFSTIGTTTGVGTVRWKKYKIFDLPVPKSIPEDMETALVGICSTIVKEKNGTLTSTAKLESELNSMIFKVYGLSEEEINYLLNQQSR